MKTILHKSKSYAIEALQLGGKQMLCDIIKWTIIMVITAVIFLCVHHIICPNGWNPLLEVNGQLAITHYQGQ